MCWCSRLFNRKSTRCRGPPGSEVVNLLTFEMEDYTMKFNYTREKRKFDARWKRLQEEYKAAGMDRLAIEELRAFDWECFAVNGFTASIS